MKSKALICCLIVGVAAYAYCTVGHTTDKHIPEQNFPPKVIVEHDHGNTALGLVTGGLVAYFITRAYHKHHPAPVVVKECALSRDVEREQRIFERCNAK